MKDNVQTNIRLDVETRDEARWHAGSLGISLRAFIEQAIRKYIRELEKKGKVTLVAK